MKSLESDLLDIARRASTLADRVADLAATPTPPTRPHIAEERLQRWHELAAGGDAQRFAQRLAWDGLDAAMVQRVLAGEHPASSGPLPAWAHTFAAALQAAATVGGATHEHAHREGRTSAGVVDRSLDSADPIPFEELLLPFLLVGRQRVAALAGGAYDLLAEAAHVSLERSLLHRLAQLAARSFELEFSLLRARRRAPLDQLRGQQHSKPANRLYQQFVEDMLAGGLLPFFREYSVLARLMAIATDFWIAATTEFFERLNTDHAEIARTFQSDAALGQVIAVMTDLSDSHRGGRTVLALAFASGLRLVYKPKDLGLEEAYAALLDWLNERGMPLPLKAPRVLDRASHGWAEYIKAAPCRHRDEAARYYRRSGMLLCLMHALEGADCHHQNIIAWGEHPILVDMETLLQHRLRRAEAPEGQLEAQSVAARQLWESVLRTSLLPQWEFGAQGRAYDVSGLGAVAEQETPFRAPQWVDINTDRMTITFAYTTVDSPTHLPSLDGAPLSADDFIEEIIDGFQECYRFLMRQRTALLAPDGPLAAMARQHVRVILRPTKLYETLLYKTLKPTFLRDGVDRSIALDMLSRSLLRADTRPALWPIVEYERQALEQLDIPLFSVPADSDALPLGSGHMLERCFIEPGYERVTTLISTLSEEDLALQTDVIRSALYAHIARAPGASADSAGMVEQTVAAPRHAPPSAHEQAVAPLTAEELVRAATAIGEDLRRRAVRAPDGSATWVGLAYVIEADRFQLQPLGDELYNGSSGVALFLAALARISGAAEFRDLALAAVQPIGKHLSDPAFREEMARLIGIGSAAGLGSVAYALARIGQLLDEPALLEHARQAALLITPDRIAADRQFDLMSGSAGAILSLLALHRLSPDRLLIERALMCGERLLQGRIATAVGQRAWPDNDGRTLTGLAHGAAGIAYALLRLYQATEERAFLAAAQESIAYEQALFSPDVGNWPDLRASARGIVQDGRWFMTSWCHGAPGIGLARIAGLPILDTPAIRRDIDVALATTRAHASYGVDHLCCGNFGRIDILLMAAARLGRPELHDVAQQRAAWVLQRAGPSRAFSLFANLPIGVYNPGLFPGAAGIGYGLLRLARPNALPALLVWE